MADAAHPRTNVTRAAAARAVFAAVCVGIGGVTLWFLWDSLIYRFGTPGELGPTLWNKQAWYWIHAVLAIPTLVLAPLQFSRTVRARWPRVHRWTGRIYVVGTLVAACVAVVLAASTDNLGGRMPLIMLAGLWFFFTASAWATAMRRDFVSHRLFMLRSVNCALAFVWIRGLGMIPDALLFPYIEDRAITDASREWITATIPILLMEAWITWLPQLRGLKRRQPAAP